MKTAHGKIILASALAVFLLAGCGRDGSSALPDEESGIGRIQSVAIENPADSAASLPAESAFSETGPGQEISGEGAVASGQGYSGAGAVPSGKTEGEEIISSGQESFKQTESSGPEITLVMVGDILLHTPVAESARLEDGGYDFSAVFAEMRDEIEGADLALVNQEVIIGGAELGVSGYPAFNAPYELGDALADVGFDVVLHATNHALDKGKRGILNCLAFWRENYPDMAVLGIHDSGEAQREIYVYEQDGIRIAVLNYTYGTNGIALPADMPYAVDLLEKNRVIEDLQAAGELADFVVVCPHWGTEYTLSATAEQRKWAELFAENGADLVLGTHPHVIEPVEWVMTESGKPEEGNSKAVNSDVENLGEENPGAAEGADKALVYYSLGNFVNWTSGTGEGVANRMVGGMARVTIGRDDAGNAVVKSYDVEPLVCHVEQGFGGVVVYPLEEYTTDLAERNEIVRQDANFSLEYCRDLVSDVFGEDY